MTDDQRNDQPQGEQQTENIQFDGADGLQNANADVTARRSDLPDDFPEDFQMPEGFPEMDENMMAQVQEMMGQLQKGQRADELEQENADLKNRLGRLAADFEGYRTRTAQDVSDAQSKGISKAAEALMPVYDDIARALSMGSEDPSKLIPGMQAVQSKVLGIFAGLGLEPTGQEGEAFDPTYHEAIQVIEGEDGMIVQTYELGFRMGDRCVRPARVVVSQKG
ncbi:nucleotide exchange factor GrpE [Deinococcus radiophilus]|uniref:Protein GrpE n=2 Tax=Deinococcus radiophilus TaxID=32062 RepID=A0A3S0KBV6_9DEIO|nr:nucleotide exchange factor GrpE [Deinococcus radiophilus]RTR21146.1 nucleotide exchange factor GrpE [Deinococcus radiophilus]